MVARSPQAKAKRKATSKRWKQENYHKVRVYVKTHKKRHPQNTKAKADRYKLKRKYKLSIAEYRKLLEDQGGVCAIHKGPETKINKHTGQPQRLSVDHDHTTGRVRGLLCDKCNNLLRCARDSILILESGIEYLKK